MTGRVPHPHHPPLPIYKMHYGTLDCFDFINSCHHLKELVKNGFQSADLPFSSPISERLKFSRFCISRTKQGQGGIFFLVLLSLCHRPCNRLLNYLCHRNQIMTILVSASRHFENWTSHAPFHLKLQLLNYPTKDRCLWRRGDEIDLGCKSWLVDGLRDSGFLKSPRLWHDGIIGTIPCS